MSAETIQSQYDHLQSVAQRFIKRAEAIQQMQSKMASQTQRLAGTWEGKAATSFLQEMRTDIFPALQRLSKALQQGGTTTTKIAQIMREAEEEAARLFQGQANGGVPAESYGGGGLENGGMGGGGLENGGEVILAQYIPPEQGGTPAQTDEGYTIEDVQQTELNVFFSQYENSDDISDEVLEKYLTNPELMAIQQEIVTDLANRVQNGEPPLTPQQFYEMVLAETGDPATALIVAHNITKSLARGLSPIGWEKISTEPLIYAMNGQEFTFDPATFHPDALATNNGTPSVFYAMFDSQSLGTNDPGDWYHYYLQASASYLGATGQIDFNDGGGGMYGDIVDGAVDSSMDQMREGYSADNQNSNAVNGWMYANSLSFLEGGVYGSDYSENAEEAQTETTRESTLHRDGALFGLELAGVTPPAEMVWYVPIAGGIGTPGVLDVVFGGGADVNLGEDTYATITPDGTTTVVNNEEGNGGGGR
jgi:WXG100 family type VII secretion target